MSINPERRTSVCLVFQVTAIQHKKMLVREEKTMKHPVLLFGVATLGSMSFPEPADAASPAFECPHAFTPSNSAKLLEVQRLLPEGNPLDHVDRLNATFDALRRDGLSRSEIMNHPCETWS